MPRSPRRSGSQATISRAITALTPLLESALTRLIPVAEDVDLGQIIIDGTAASLLDLEEASRAVLWKAQDHRLQRPSRPRPQGRIQWVSDPVDGRRHDTATLTDVSLEVPVRDRHVRIVLAHSVGCDSKYVWPFGRCPHCDLSTRQGGRRCPGSTSVT